jgi:hypothetical protein
VSTAKLFALYRLGMEYHSGQWSQGYRVHCRAASRLLKRGIRHPWDSPTGFGPHNWPRAFRRDVARYLRAYRHVFKRHG